MASFARLVTPKFLLGIFVITLAYLCLNVYVANYSLIDQTIVGNFPLIYKTTLLSALFEGLFTAISSLEFVMMVIIGLLTGTNLMLILGNKQNFFKLRSANMAVGLGTLFGTATSGCASCGLPLLGLLGLTGSVSFLPFKGMEFSFLAIGLLIVSCVVLLRQNAKACVIK